MLASREGHPTTLPWLGLTVRYGSGSSNVYAYCSWVQSRHLITLLRCRSLTNDSTSLKAFYWLVALVPFAESRLLNGSTAGGAYFRGIVMPRCAAAFEYGRIHGFNSVKWAKTLNVIYCSGDAATPEFEGIRHAHPLGFGAAMDPSECVQVAQLLQDTRIQLHNFNLAQGRDYARLYWHSGIPKPWPFAQSLLHICTYVPLCPKINAVVRLLLSVNSACSLDRDFADALDLISTTPAHWHTKDTKIPKLCLMKLRKVLRALVPPGGTTFAQIKLQDRRNFSIISGFARRDSAPANQASKY
ncbi:hypothetical protein B0H15DRAFT_804204 [Mycena belliarum]|uniref:Uncharacterized protein n=1 Tax=Mycena belliarum TaxID=1033014 RepID=A0AAD6XLP8_9AGAR|nr:hypothetical protein B0H15DRAFT_804204 [Mycena belliae]